MQYITGLIAYGVPCELDSCGTWTLSKKDFTDPGNCALHESDDSIFKDYGIEKNKLVPWHEEPMNVANHVRAYLDSVEALKFDELAGVFENMILSDKCRALIFRNVHGRLRHTSHFREINRFMTDEFGSYWVSYCQSRLAPMGTDNAKQVSAK